LDTRSFAVDLSKAWAWPVAVLTIIIMFRRPLVELISRIENLKYGDFQLNFTRLIKTVRTLADRALPKGEEIDRTQTLKIRTIRDTFTDLAKEDPNAAVVAAWAEVERILLETGQRIGLTSGDDPTRRNPVFIARALFIRKSVDPLTYDFFVKLRRLKNLAAHGQIKLSQAIEFVELAARFISKVNTASRTDGEE
jgi:hypothetical protein